jgi:hypothetical protein
MPEHTAPLQDPLSSEPATTGPEDTLHTRGDAQQRIAERAYELYEKRGGEPGRDQEDWFQAERDLTQPT